MLANLQLTDLVALLLGAGCIVLAAVLAFRKGGGGAGSLKLPGIEISGKGSAALFLMVGAALIFMTMVLGDTRGVKDEAVQKVSELGSELEVRNLYIGELESKVPLTERPVRPPMRDVQIPDRLRKELMRAPQAGLKALGG